ncbi:hypothetical protein GQ42DRAFT_165796 [Ramicandelaber brevisporus]|nr:hypothetical protein GQ42DRAFT_165796 [Ramicandelaber brevisporus]
MKFALVIACLAAVTVRANSGGCVIRTCISVINSGFHVDTIDASVTPGGDFFGHFRIWGSGFDHNSSEQVWRAGQKYTLRVDRDVPNGSMVCAQGWEHSNGQFISRGKACEEVRL